MDWKAENEDYIDWLKRIVAMLFALADLADRASVATLSVRRRVLAILQKAKSVGQASVAGTAHDLGVAWVAQSCDPPPPALFMHYGDDPADATNLALRLRALAFVLANLALLAQRLTRDAAAAETDYPALREIAPALVPARQLSSHSLVVLLHGLTIRAPPVVAAI